MLGSSMEVYSSCLEEEDNEKTVVIQWRRCRSPDKVMEGGGIGIQDAEVDSTGLDVRISYRSQQEEGLHSAPRCWCSSGFSSRPRALSSALFWGPPRPLPQLQPSDARDCQGFTSSPEASTAHPL